MADLDTRPLHLISDDERQDVADIMRLFGYAQANRATAASHWNEVAELILPSHRNTFYYGDQNTEGEKKTDKQIDSSGAIALSRFAAICNSLLTPRNMQWHGLEADDPYVMKDRATMLYFEQVGSILFKERYRPAANFAKQNSGIWQALGAFGNGYMFCDQLDDPDGGHGLRYKAVPTGRMFIQENHQGIVDGFIRWEQFTARQIYQKWPDTFPEQMKTALTQGSITKYDVLQHVCPRDDYDSARIDDVGKPYKSTYISVQGLCVLERGGYFTFPCAASRYENAPGELYGRSPAMMVLPSLKTLNAQKRVFLKQGHRAGDPVLLTPDGGMIDFSMRPGAMNPGGVNEDGKAMVHTLPTGDINITKEMMGEEKSLINDAFLVSIMQILAETPTMSATEVLERTNEKGILLAPTIGAQGDEYLGRNINRELDVLARLRKLPPMPPRLREAGGRYSVVYTSPLSRASRAQEASGFMRTLEAVNTVAQITQDPSLYDTFDFTAAVPGIAEINGVMPSWMANPKQIAEKVANRAAVQKRQEAIQAAPAAAAMQKANVAAHVAGMGPDDGQPQGA